MDTVSELNTLSFNYWDIIVAVSLILSVLNGYRAGLLKSVFSMVSFIIVIAATYYLLPAASKFLRLYTGIYGAIKSAVTDSLGLQALAKATTKQAETKLIDSLPLPEFIKTSLLANNNDAVYEILGVQNIIEYISGYVANICINVIAAILLLTVTTIALALLVNVLDLFSKLPIINTMNKLGGIIFGLCQGILLLWIIFTLITLFIFIPIFKDSYMVLLQSEFASKIYSSNLLLKTILAIFA